QISLFKDFSKVEQQTNKLVFIEQAIREYISTGRVARCPPTALNDQMSPVYGIRNGRFIQTQV
ncbi:MAG: hypothetical protein EZS28_003423, partial [Streblomastix strix]